jgi:hypothetical protein
MKAMFQGNNGKLSMMRFLSFIVTVACIPVLYIHPDQATPVCALIGGAIAGKWLQKKGEQNVG